MWEERLKLYTINGLACAVAEVIGGVTVNINKNAAPENGSYRVIFDYFKS